MYIYMDIYIHHTHTYIICGRQLGIAEVYVDVVDAVAHKVHSVYIYDIMYHTHITWYVYIYCIMYHTHIRRYTYIT